MTVRLVLADTGPLYAALNPRDQYYERAQAELSNLADDSCEVAVIYPTILETYSLILRNLQPHDAIQWLEDIAVGTHVLEIGTDDYKRAFEIVGRFTDQDVTLFDALLATVSIRSNLRIWTYDHHFDILGAERWYPGT